MVATIHKREPVRREAVGDSAESYEENVAMALQNLNTRWLGFRYVVVPTNYSSISDALLSAGLISVGVTEVIFPKVEIEKLLIPTLSSTQKRYIPNGITYGEITIKAPVTRNASLWSYMEKQMDALQGGSYDQFNMVIGLFGSNTALDVLPITLWFCEGCQATSFTIPSANSDSATEMPLEEITFQVDKIYRPTLKSIL